MWPNPCKTTPAWSVHDRCLVGMVVPSFSWECWLQCIYYKSLWFNGWPFPCSGWESPVLTMVHLGASFWETLRAELEDGYDMRSDTPYRRFIVRWSEDNVPTTMILGSWHWDRILDQKKTWTDRHDCFTRKLRIYIDYVGV